MERTRELSKKSSPRAQNRWVSSTEITEIVSLCPLSLCGEIVPRECDKFRPVVAARNANVTTFRRAPRPAPRSNHPAIRSDARFRTQTRVRGGNRVCAAEPCRGPALQRFSQRRRQAPRIRRGELRHAGEPRQASAQRLARRLDL